MKQPEAKQAAYLFAISIAVSLLSRLLPSYADALFAVSVLLWIVASVDLAIAKGYNGAWGLVGITCLGTVILLFIPDKNAHFSIGTVEPIRPPDVPRKPTYHTSAPDSQNDLTDNNTSDSRAAPFSPRLEPPQINPLPPAASVESATIPRVAPPLLQKSVEQSDYSTTAVVSLVVGLFSAFAWCLPIAGIPLSITGLVLAIVSRQSPRRRFAIAGIILNSMGLVMSILTAVGEMLKSAK